MNSCQMRAGHVPPYTVMLVVGGDIVTSSVGNPAHTAVESDEAYPQKPSKHLYVRSVAPWETLPDDGAERHDTRSG